MSSFRLNRKYITLTAFFVLPLLCMAQKRQFQFFPIAGIELQREAFIGRLGSHFFMLHLDNGNGLDLFIYDTTTKKGLSKQYDLPRPVSSINVQEHSIIFASASPTTKGTEYHLLELNEEGEVLHKKEGMLNVRRGPVNAIASADKKFLLFYQFKKTGGDSVILTGSLLDQEGNPKKQIAYSFKQDDNLDAEPEIFLDVFGNTHVLVFDKFTNYRLSTDLTVNTIPLADENIISETFTFEKVKLKTMRVFQNNECKCLQAEGLYVDGFNKVNKGIYSIAFPPGRKNQLAPRFIPFTAAMIRNFKQGFSATEEAVQNSLQLQEIVYSDSGSFAIFRLYLGIPQKVQNTRPEDDPNLKSLNKSLSISRGGENMATINPNAVTNGVRGTAARMSSMTQADRYTNIATQKIPSNSTPPLSSRSIGRNAPKLICVKLEKEEGFAWKESRSLDVFTSPDYELFNRLFLVTGEKQEISAMLYQADQLDEPYPVFISIKAGGQTVQKFPEKKIVFSPALFLDTQQYASLYLNTETGLGGLMVIYSKR